jgi:hypothetical protein
MEKKPKKGFIALLKRKFNKQKRDKSDKEGSTVPEWMKKLPDAERRKAIAVHKANKKNKK